MNRIATSLAIGTIAVLLGSGCKIVVTGADTYETCSFSSDCGSSTDSCITIPGPASSLSACSHTCTDDLDCEYGGRCVTAGSGNFCVESCSSDFSCELGWSCQGFDARGNICLPGSSGIPAYDECSPSGDSCLSPNACYTISVDGASRGVCTDSCSSDATCPYDSRGFNGRCLSFDGGGVYSCFESCVAASDCAVGFACKSALSDGTSFPAICLPI